MTDEELKGWRHIIESASPKQCVEVKNVRPLLDEIDRLREALDRIKEGK